MWPQLCYLQNIIIILSRQTNQQQKICKSILRLKLIENSCLPAQGDLRLSCKPGSVFLAKMKNPFLNINSINCIHPIQLVKVQRHMRNIFDKYSNKSFFQHKYKCLSYSLTIYCNTAELHKPTELQKQEHESVQLPNLKIRNSTTPLTLPEALFTIPLEFTSLNLQR